MWLDDSSACSLQPSTTNLAAALEIARLRGRNPGRASPLPGEIPYIKMPISLLSQRSPIEVDSWGQTVCPMRLCSIHRGIQRHFESLASLAKVLHIKWVSLMHFTKGTRGVQLKFYFFLSPTHLIAPIGAVNPYHHGEKSRPRRTIRLDLGIVQPPC